MKILGRALISGWVEAVDSGLGTIEMAGIRLHMEHGAVVSVGDFLEVEAIYSSDRVWSARIRAQFGEPESAAPLSPQAHTRAPAPTSTVVPASTMGASTSVSQAQGADTAAGAPGPQTPAGTQTGTVPLSRGARYGNARPQAKRPNGPSADGGSAKAESRPRFTPSSADQRVEY